MGPLQGIRNPFRMGHEIAEILPDKLIELTRRTVARITTLDVLRIKRLNSATTHVVTVAVDGGPGHTGRLAHATTDQCPQ